MWRRFCFLAVFTACVVPNALRAQEDLNDLLERMTKEAARIVGPSVVQIETRGGTDIVVAGPKGQTFRKALGPTTGVVVDPSGYIITSAFNFLNSPTTILVRIPGKGGEPLVATRVATDKSRMLTLLKVDAKGLPVPTVVSKSELREGQWAIALGRALDTKMEKSPAVSIGIISALGRVWGKAIQTDAKISPINYGGPIVDIQGRVQGILIPASPTGSDETAGFEWYDSGIGFAIPMEDVIAALPRLKAGKDLERGMLGIAMKNAGDIYSVLPEIGAVVKGSAAAKAGLKPGDIIVEIDGKPVTRMAQIQHILGVKYTGEKVSLKYKRGKDVVAVKSLELITQNQPIAQPFLGILPLRDDPKLGVEVRYVFPGSPADKVGIKAGDRIVKYGPDEKQLVLFTGEKRGRIQFLEGLAKFAPGDELKLEIRRSTGKTEIVTALLDYLPGALPGAPATVPEKLPEIASARKALEPLEVLIKDVKKDAKDVKKIKKDGKDIPDFKKDVKEAKEIKKDAKEGEANFKRPETGFLERNTPDGESKYWLWVDDNYDPNVAHAVVVWLHPPGKNKKEDMADFSDLWEDVCKEHNIILVMPIFNNEEGWIPSAAAAVVAATRDTMSRYNCDAQRVVAHGMGVGGQMALHLGFGHRELFRGVAAVGATVGQIKDNTLDQRLSFYLAAGDLDPLAKTIAETRVRLADRRYPAIYRDVPERGREYLTEKYIRETARWIDMLDRQ